jgi:uncharacterized membrane protein YgcG
MDIWAVLIVNIFTAFLVLVIARVAYVFVRHRRSFNRELLGESGSRGGSNEGGSDDSWSDFGGGGGCGGGGGN